MTRHRSCRGPFNISKWVLKGQFQPSVVLFSCLEDLYSYPAPRMRERG